MNTDFESIRRELRARAENDTDPPKSLKALAAEVAGRLARGDELPWDDFDHVLASYAFDLQEEDARAGCSSPASWRSEWWDFTRCLKAHPAWQDSAGIDAFSNVTEAVAYWFDDDTSLDEEEQVERWFGDYDDLSRAVIQGWEKIRNIPGVDPLILAAEDADRCPVDLSDISLTLPSKKYRRFLSFVAHLHRAKKATHHLILPAREVGDALGYSKNTASGHINAAMADGLLTRTRQHKFRSNGSGRAAEYQFHPHRVPSLRPPTPKEAHE